MEQNQLFHDVLVNCLLWIRMQVFAWTHWKPFVNANKKPQQTQKRLLQTILALNRDTTFGKAHNFRNIINYHDFINAIQIQDYESLRPLIEEQERTGKTILNTDTPVMYAQTSGTTGQPKLIPLLERTLTLHKHSQAIQTYAQFKTAPEAYYGKLLGIVSPAEEGQLDSGTPYGSASGHVYRNMPKIARAKYVIPHEVFSIEDYDLKYLVILRLALIHQNITLIGSANPSTFLKLVSVLQAHRKALLEDIQLNRFRYMDKLTADVKTAIKPRLHCKPSRLEDLERLLQSSEPRVADLWPDLRLVNTWTGGSCAIALAAFKKHLPATTRIGELGYLSSEFRGSITVDLDHNLTAPTIHENFFEFVEREHWDNGVKNTITLEAVEEGKQYYVIVTTGAGLYRYFMNDIVVITGRFHQTPTISFVQKGKGVTNITGEKLYESQVISAVQAAEKSLSIQSVFFLMLADVKQSTYRLMIELTMQGETVVDQMTDAIESTLSQINVEYAAKRCSGRLEKLEVIFLKPGSGEAYKHHCLKQGQREGQFKIIALQYHDDCNFAFAKHSVH